MSPLHRLFQRFIGMASATPGKKGLAGYLVYALGEIILIVTGILVAISLNNWNENRKQEEKFFNTIERIYQTVREVNDGIRWDIVLLQNQVALIDQLLDAPEKVPDEELVYRLFNLDNPKGPNPELYRGTQYLTSLLDVDSGNPRQVDTATSIANYLRIGVWNSYSNSNDPKVFEPVTFLLTQQGIPTPNIGWALSGLLRWDQDRPLLNANHLQKARALLATEAMRNALIAQRAIKISFLESEDNDRENTEQTLKLIRTAYPDVKLHYNDIGIIGSALAGGWQQSVPMQRQTGDNNIWEIDIELGEGKVKFRESDSWTVNWGGVGFPEGQSFYFGQDIVVEPGRYHVEFNLDKNSYRFTRLDP